MWFKPKPIFKWPGWSVMWFNQWIWMYHESLNYWLKFLFILVATHSNLQLKVWWCHVMLANKIHPLSIMIENNFQLKCYFWLWWFLVVNSIFQLPKRNLLGLSFAITNCCWKCNCKCWVFFLVKVASICISHVCFMSPFHKLWIMT
jgi:hypothetical protein